ncbi:Peptidoglycan glycosyltransferase FtsW [Phycisphaerae bacterium RAS1]|nr:Peptidoglycan glycosyltransferase FtsW [Phycisphaerae bacterium RAS1]
MATIPGTHAPQQDLPVARNERTLRSERVTLDEHGPLSLYDGLIVFITGVLMVIGVVMVYSASVTLQGAAFDPREWWKSPLRQCVFTLAGFLTLVFVAHVDYRALSADSRWGRACAAGLWLAALGLLVAVLIPGVGSEQLGARRWLVLLRSPFTLGFQPGEFAKVALVVCLAALLSASGFDVRRFWRGFVPACSVGGVLIALTGIEDFGTAALMGVLMVAMLVLGGARWLHLGAVTMAGLAAGAALLAAEPYRVQRLKTFLSETPDPAGDGYQVMQGLIAIASGGWWGRGLGAGIQKYGYLPQDNNDFILAVICEEFGVAGGITVIALFLCFLLRGWWISARAPDRLGQLLATGLTLMITLQAAFNVGVITNSIPTKGISLPFVSAGGSGVLFLGLAVGLLAGVGRRRTT